MNRRFQLLCALFFVAPLLLSAEPTLEEAESNGMKETLLGYVDSSEFIVDVCIYNEKWGFEGKSKLTYSCVVTQVHKGDIAVGTKIEYNRFFEERVPFLPADGELRVLFFSPGDGEKIHDRWLLKGDAGFSIKFGQLMHQLFLLQKEVYPPLKQIAK